MSKKTTLTRLHVYRDEILSRLLVDLFQSKKEHPHEENHTKLTEQPASVETANAENNQKRSDIRQTVR